jgi:hypothetical protein
MDFYSYTDSTENDYHYQLNIYTFKSLFLTKMIEHLNHIKRKHLNNYLNNYYFNIIKDFPIIFKNKISFLKVAYLPANHGQNIYYNDILFKNLIENNIIHAISLKKLNLILDNSVYNFFTELPSNFDFNIYKKYADIKNYTNEQLTDHFLKNGQFEARNYTKETNILPKYIKDFLSNCKDLLFYFELPDDFNVYNYKIKNNDLAKLEMNRNELYIHWLRYGKKENRQY